MTTYEIGRLLRAGTRGFVVGCQVSQLEAPSFGALVRAPVSDDYQVYGMIQDIHIDDDGLVRQLVTAGEVDEAIIADNRLNRNLPIEMSVLAVGYRQNGAVSHLLPPRPPLSLDVIFLCEPEEVREFCGSARFGYFRHLLREPDAPIGELLAAHLEQARAAQPLAEADRWWQAALRELITLLRDDYPALMGVLSTLGELEAR